jgi:hypothetical protein
MGLTSDTWQLVVVDTLFLCLAGGLGLWVRAWLGREHEATGRRLAALEARQAQLERAGERLEGLCQLLEARLHRAGAASDAGLSQRSGLPLPRKGTGEAGDQEDNYEQARKLLDQGLPPGEVARQVRLGLAEIELMNRLLHRQRRIWEAGAASSRANLESFPGRSVAKVSP